MNNHKTATAMISQQPDDLHRLLADAIQDMPPAQLLEFVTRSLSVDTLDQLFADNELARARIAKYRSTTLEALEALRTHLLIALHTHTEQD
jgi:hypothetical protein